MIDDLSEADKPRIILMYAEDYDALEKLMATLLPGELHCALALFRRGHPYVIVGPEDPWRLEALSALAGRLADPDDSDGPRAQFDREGWLCVEGPAQVIGVQGVLLSWQLLIAAPDADTVAAVRQRIVPRLQPLRDFCADLIRNPRISSQRDSPMYGLPGGDEEVDKLFND